MKRPMTVVSLVLLAGCGGTQESCEPGFGDWSLPDTVAPTTAVATTRSGPGTISFLNSNPRPGATIAGCGPTIEACSARLKIVFNLRPNVDLRGQQLHVSLFAEDQARLECSSTPFDLDAGVSFPIEVACPTATLGAATPFRSATLRVETGAGADRIAQDWNVGFAFAP
jgi:hypothetical protein